MLRRTSVQLRVRRVSKRDCAGLLVFIARQRLRTPQSLYQILQIVSVSAFEQAPLAELLAESAQEEIRNHPDNQLSFNGL